jgi:hypothetical protein
MPPPYSQINECRAEVYKKIEELQIPEHPKFVNAFNRGVNSYFTGDWKLARHELEKVRTDAYLLEGREMCL